MPIVTTNVDTKPYNLPSLEHLGKYDPSEQKKVLENTIKAQKERLNSITSLNRDLSNGVINRQQFEKQKAIINENIANSFRRTPVTNIDKGDNGLIPVAHKNKLAFVFVGDTEKSESNELFDINAPKICFAVGGGLETFYDPNNNKLASIKPKNDYMPEASAQLHLISNSDIDVEGILEIPTLKNRSAIKAESDVLDFSAKEVVFIRSLGRPYNSSGTRVFTPGGVHIVSGTNLKEEEKPQPMVLGRSLMDFLSTFTDLVNLLVSTVINISSDLINLKLVLKDHVHFISPQTGPLPSASVLAYVIQTAIKDDLVNVGNLYSILLNLEMQKTNHLTALSSKKFISEFNKVN